MREADVHYREYSLEQRGRPIYPFSLLVLYWVKGYADNESLDDLASFDHLIEHSLVLVLLPRRLPLPLTG